MPANLPSSAPRILDAGDTAFTIEFGDRIDPALQARVNALDVAIRQAHRTGGFTGLIETVPTFRSLTLLYDPLVGERTALLTDLASLTAADHVIDAPPTRHWRLPACYQGEAAPDLDEVARLAGLSTDDVVRLHSCSEYVVYMLGFLPGFPFMGDVAPALRLPRRHEPRVRVPAGSVAIATGLTAIYPWESPGGWHLLGRCPVPLFDAGRAGAPALLQAGDRVGFEPVDTREYQRLSKALADRDIDPLRWCDTPEATA